jgi:type IV pilus assembly protein PilX
MSLVISLIFMLALLLLGVASMSVNTMQERMVGNMKDQDLAMQAAEAALRDAETYLGNTEPGVASFHDDCTGGLCNPANNPSAGSADSRPIYAVKGWTNAIVYGTAPSVSAATFPLVAQQPKYLIEYMGPVRASYGDDPNAPVGYAYRISALGVGAQQSTQVVLQSMFILKS